jgi:hypothetical protein
MLCAFCDHALKVMEPEQFRDWLLRAYQHWGSRPSVPNKVPPPNMDKLLPEDLPGLGQLLCERSLIPTSVHDDLHSPYDSAKGAEEVVYILELEAGHSRYYIGQTTRLGKRLTEHRTSTPYHKPFIRYWVLTYPGSTIQQRHAVESCITHAYPPPLTSKFHYGTTTPRWAAAIS